MEQVYALCDRRCRTQTALDKLAKLRRRVQRFTSLGDTLKKLFAPTLDKALTSVAERSFSLLDCVKMFVKPMAQPLLRSSR
jgi:hypothetical protein